MKTHAVRDQESTNKESLKSLLKKVPGSPVKDKSRIESTWGGGTGAPDTKFGGLRGREEMKETTRQKVYRHRSWERAAGISNGGGRAQD